MASPHRYPRRASPPQTPSKGLFGMEKVMLPAPSTESLSFRSCGSTPCSSTSHFNKPLPQCPPRRNSNTSAYSGDSGYTTIIQSYTDRFEEEQPIPTIIQPKAYRDTVAALLEHREDLIQRLVSPPAMSQFPRHSQSIPSLQRACDRSVAMAACENRQAPSFCEFSHNMQNRRWDAVCPLFSGATHDGYQVSHGLLSPPLSNYRQSYDQHHQYLPGPISGTITDIIDSGIMPQPLNLNTASTLLEQHRTKLRQMSEHRGIPTYLIDIREAQQRRLEEKQRDLEERRRELLNAKMDTHEPYLVDIKEAQRRAQESKRSIEPYPDAEPHRWSYKSDSFVIYTRFRESMKAVIKQFIHKKKKERQMIRDRKRVMLIAEEKYPAMKPVQDEHKLSWVSSRKSSLHEGVNTVLRNLSISGSLADKRGITETNEEERGRPLERGRRQEQLVIPPSPYQKYGAEVWYAKNKKTKNANAKRFQRTPTKMLRAKYEPETMKKPQHAGKISDEVAEHFRIGRSQLIHALGVPKNIIYRKRSDAKSKELKQSISVVGPASLEYAAGRFWL